MPKILCPKIDFDLEIEKEIYENAKETIAYLSDVVKSIERRVLSGEKIEGFALVPGRKTRYITSFGEDYLPKVLGEEAYKVTKKIIGITDLEKLLPAEEIVALHQKGVIDFKEGSPQIITTK